MDTSVTYIKMCDCPEIQGQKPDGSQGEFVYCEEEAYQEMDDSPFTPFIWLPRQDQLQNMLRNKPSYLQAWGLALGFSRFINNNFYPIAYSMEQLWLIFIIHELYGKAWSMEKEEWIHETSP